MMKQACNHTLPMYFASGTRGYADIYTNEV